MEKKLYEEDHELPSPWEWIIVIALSASLAGFGWLVYSLIPDGPRRWDFGQLPDTPAESVFSTETPKAVPQPPRQLPRLPEATPEPPPQKPMK